MPLVSFHFFTVKKAKKKTA